MDRKQTVQFKTEQSEERPINCCVQQGSILGPLLFILYVNDLPKVCSKTKVILYADNTAILCKGKNIAQIQNTLNSEMNLCSDWFTQNKLHLNVSKTKSMLFGTSQRLSFQLLFTIYLSKKMFNPIVLPHFTYCDNIWASSYETNISRLQKLQNTCAGIILNENRRSHVQPRLDSLSWMPIIVLIKYHTL